MGDSIGRDTAVSIDMSPCAGHPCVCEAAAFWQVHVTAHPTAEMLQMQWAQSAHPRRREGADNMVHALKPGSPTRLLLLAGRLCHLEACRPQLGTQGTPHSQHRLSFRHHTAKPHHHRQASGKKHLLKHAGKRVIWQLQGQHVLSARSKRAWQGMFYQC